MNKIVLVDLNKDFSSTNIYLSNTLINSIEKSFIDNKKILLYINKRGAYDFVVCQDCGNIEKCSKCDISFTVHNNPLKLVCHHCFSEKNYPISCSKCFGTNIKKIGVGTQQIEKTLQDIFSSKNIFRMDKDNVGNISQKKDSLKNMLKADIIIGTKMITTGFDFQNIGTIGIILLEQELQLPYYDIEERVYNNLKQLLGRGSRDGQETEVVIQTMIPSSDIINDLVYLNYKDFFKKTLNDRKIFNYPPFSEMRYLTYKSDKKEITLKFIDELYNKLISLSLNDIEIIKIDNTYKRDNKYYQKIILKGKNIRNYLFKIKKDIYLNSDLVLSFT